MAFLQDATADAYRHPNYLGDSQMSYRSVTRLASCLLAFSLVAAACGSDDDEAATAP